MAFHCDIWVQLLLVVSFFLPSSTAGHFSLPVLSHKHKHYYIYYISVGEEESVFVCACVCVCVRVCVRVCVGEQ